MHQLEVARSAARAGGQVISRYFREGVAMRKKDDANSYNLVSDADLESERAIVGVIRETYPDHSFLGEEMYQDDIRAEHLWVIDPLDGTNNFAHQLPHFAVSVAYYYRAQAMCGVIFNPLREDLYEVVRGQGARYNGRPAQVAGHSQLDEIFVGVGFYYDRGAMMEATLDAIRELFQQHIHGIRRMGTASLDLALVGTGAFGAFFEYQLSPWDYAAGRLFVEEAGGQVSTCRGQPLSLTTTSLLATNGKLHPSVLDIVRKHVPA